jgi:hypothetical protein
MAKGRPYRVPFLGLCSCGNYLTSIVPKIIKEIGETPIMTREEYITSTEIAFERLMTPTKGIWPEQMEQPMAEGKWSFKDLAAHLVLWDGLVVRALEQMNQGESFDWTPYRDVDASNAAAVEKLRVTPLKRVLSELRITHSTVIEAVRRVPDEKLYRNGELPEWLLSTVPEHYEHHRGQVEEWAEKIKAEKLPPLVPPYPKGGDPIAFPL